MVGLEKLMAFIHTTSSAIKKSIFVVFKNQKWLIIWIYEGSSFIFIFPRAIHQHNQEWKYSPTVFAIDELKPPKDIFIEHRW